MKTNGVSAIIMLLAGGVYCLLGIFYQMPLMDFLVQLLLVLLVFWILGGIVRMVLDRFMGAVADKAKEEEKEAEGTDTEGENEESEEAKSGSEEDE